MSRLLLPLALLVCAAGCLPMEPTWLPDSSGLVYTRQQEVEEPTLIRHIDLENKRERTIASLKNCGTSPPAVSPAGDKVAVLEARLEGDRRMVKVRVFDLAGKELHTSAEIATDDTTGNRPGWDAVTWSPVGGKLLLWISPGAVYDLETEKVLALDKSYSVDLFFLLHKQSPFLPDGSGMIVVKKDVDGTATGQPALWTWDGKLKLLEGNEEAFQKYKQSLEGITYWPLAGRWDGNVARHPKSDGEIVIDPVGGTVRFEKSDELAKLHARMMKERWVSSTTFAGGARLVARRIDQRTTDPRFALEIVADGKEAKVVAESILSGYDASNHHVPLYASPNGKLIAVKYRREGSKPRLMVVDASGEIVSDVEL